jgi:lipopolysaccharide biosynthesis glycosyltransferase
MKNIKGVITILMLMIGLGVGSFPYVINELKAEVRVVKDTKNCTPAFKENNISVVLACDDNYALYCGVAIRSLIDNSSDGNNYDIWILDGGISEEHREDILSLSKNKKNISIRFFDIGPYAEQYAGIFFVNGHISAAAYYRLFIPQIFYNYKKIAYLDCDIIVNADIAELYNTDLGGESLGAIRTHHVCGGQNCDWGKYCEGALKMSNHENYFNSGVLLFNVAKIYKEDFSGKCFSKLQELGNCATHDEGVLNAVCEKETRFIDEKWDVQWHWKLPHLNWRIFNEPWNGGYHEARMMPSILHYTTGDKPWSMGLCEPGVDLWWYHARKTPFYNKIKEKHRR